MFQNRIILLVIFLCCFVLKLSFSRKVTDCYANDLNPYLLFGTKTSYEFIYERHKPDDNIENCEPVQIWMLARHGTRYPGRNIVRAMHSLQDLKIQILHNHEEQKNGRLCQPDLENLRTWSLNVTMADSNLLTQQGRDEMKSLARRIKNKFPYLFQHGFSDNLFVFRHTMHERTRQSAQAFADGLFGPNAGIWIPPGIENDPLTHPYENCTYWLKNVENNPETTRERDLFLKGLEMTALVHNVSQRLGFLYDLPEETILRIYDMCRYNKAWAVNDRSPWCAAFTTDELKVLEYLDDLETYFDSGYGNELNLRLGCSPLKDMLQRFEQLEDDFTQGPLQPAGVFYFSHSKLVLMMLSRMGLFGRGPPPRHYDYHEEHFREWRVSKITPFAANFYAVFLKCNTGEYNRVVFYLNEKRIDFDGCEAGLCSWLYIKHRFLDVLRYSNSDWCRNNTTNVKVSIFPFFLVVAYIIQHYIFW